MLTSNGVRVVYSGDHMWNIPGRWGGGGAGRGHLAFPGVCCRDDRSHQGEYQVQAWEGSESDQPLIFL